MGEIRARLAIEREDTYGNRVLGGVFAGIRDRICALGCNTASIQVANKTWYGNFMIPGAVGFSTPLHLLSGGTINLCYDTDTSATALIDQYDLWRKHYDDSGVTRPERELFTSDHKTCGICLEDYVLGARIFTMTPCGHIYHYDCISKWIIRHCEVCSGQPQRPDVATARRDLAAAIAAKDDKRGADILRAMCAPVYAGNTSIEVHWRHLAFGHRGGVFPCPQCGARDGSVPS